MKTKLILPGLFLVAMSGMYSCKQEDVYNGANSLAEQQFTDTVGTLKGAASFPIGLAVEYPLSSSNSKYWSVVKRESTWVTFGNELKNNALVKADGTYDFTTADNFYTLATNGGLKVFGHTLVWHSQQRASYYNSLIGGSSGGGATNLAVNPGFETTTVGTTAEPADGWQVLNGAGQFVSTNSNTNTGSKALQVNVPAGGQNYNTQIITKAQIPVTAGKTYTISYYIKGATAQSIQFEVRPFLGSTGGSVNYQGGKPVTTSYAKVSYDYAVPAGVTAIQLAFDLGGTLNTLYLDDVSITDASVVPPPTGGALALIVDNAMKKHIQTVVARYAGKITAWDVINEPFSDAAELRNNTNTPAGDKTDIFVWQNYLGRDYATKAFTYARAMDATADLYMNDYNLESSTAKLNAFVTLANELKAANTGITGVGTQMHCNINTSYTLIDEMFKKLASTGLKVRISELDVRLNPTEKVGDVGSSSALKNLQAVMYKYVLQSYLKHVPAAQRGGVLVWGVSDSDSWILTSMKKNDAPLLFDNAYQKKPAFAGILAGLKSN